MLQIGKFNERLKFLRQQKGISQHELSAQLKLIMGDSKGCSKSSINMYERGEREPSIDTLEAIADYFNVDMNYLLGKSDIPNQFALSAGPIGIVQIGKFDTADYERLFPAQLARIIEIYNGMNSVGQGKLFEYAEDLSINDRYKKGDSISKDTVG